MKKCVETIMSEQQVISNTTWVKCIEGIVQQKVENAKEIIKADMMRHRQSLLTCGLL
jgi:hypothetical protein